MLSHIHNLDTRIKRGGINAAMWWIRKQYHRIKPKNIEDINIFERDWNLLIIVDGCYVDWVREVASEVPLFDKEKIDSIVSVGSSSDDWYENTFDGAPTEELEKTTFVTANPFVGAHKPQSLGFLEQVREWGWEDTLGTVPAHKVTDAAIEAGRTTEFDRYVVHYMQPHAPFIEMTDPNDRSQVELSYPTNLPREPWYRALRGDLSSAKLRELYVDNLRYVLDEVATLCQNFDAETSILSADHGNGVGQYGLYDHPAGVKIKRLRSVPWVPIQTVDNHTITPIIDRSPTETARSEQLEALGYR